MTSSLGTNPLVVHDSFHNRLAVPQVVTLQNRKGGSSRERVGRVPDGEMYAMSNL